MKKLIVYVIGGLVFALYSCRSLTATDTIHPDYEFEYDLYNHVKWYYRATLKYPSIDELYEYYWNIVNETNGNKYLSFDEFDKDTQKNVTGRENLLRNLSLYKDDISFEKNGNSIDVLWKGKKWMKIEFDLSKMIKEKSSLFTYFYNSIGSHYKDFDYEDLFYSIRREVRDKYLTDTSKKDKFKLCLLRYYRDKGYTVYYPSNGEIKQNIYLNKLGCSLDTFLLNHDIQAIQFVISLPESYFVRR